MDRPGLCPDLERMCGLSCVQQRKETQINRKHYEQTGGEKGDRSWGS